MMRGLIVVICAFFSIIFLKRKQYRHHWTGIVLIVFGVAEVGYVAIAAGSSSDTNGSVALGILLLIVSQLFNGTMFIVEEKLLSSYYLEPFFVVGCEGMWGLVYYIFLLPIMQEIQCGSTVTGVKSTGLGVLCAYGYLENSAFAFTQMKDRPILIVQTVGSIMSIACFNSFGIACTKYASAAQRSTIDTSRTLTIWILSVLLLHEAFQPWAILGFVCLAFGTLLYNEIIVLKMFNFD
jgi:drug/metabolite transporter (DMT)-like permease